MHTFWIFFAWPNGSMWSNLLSNPIAWAAAIVGAVVFRKWLGRHLAAWWHRHHGPHTREDLAAMEDRLKAHMTAELGRITANGGTHEARHVAPPPPRPQR